MIIWFLLLMLIYSFCNWLIGQQIMALLRVNTVAFWVILAILACSPLLGRMGISSAIDKAGNFWMVFFYYATFLAVLGIFVKNKPFIIGCYLLIFILILIGSIHAKNVKVVSYDINIPKQARDFDIVMLSDTHINQTKSSDYVEKMVSDINSLHPDIVLFAGDIFDDRNVNSLKEKKEILKGIKATDGVYGVLGNHEYYSNNLSEILDIYKEANINILIDEVAELETIYIVGRDDIYKKRKNLNELLQTVNKEKPIILLDHQPVSLEEAKNNGVDLQLSGHTHKGQFFPNQLITAKIYEVDYGYLAKDSLQVIVTSGYGTWGPPVRIGTQSEILDIKIKFQK
ncbi:MAG: metallophosphoesterase [Firmicutes bacterium]|nr:metallophosphoesterase [Bacillota bacterium]